ncbi:cytochrome c oxidase assembly protein PET191-domain-containing protein [Suillus placidus]|uniref:Cytochrome c oxidase assembly protein PET191-domain-containing protein n=1 Tax=Suillus placidus TaxID=48579 RepID=A0A9P7A0Z5_9AGAM|nr:cytochrome c oxidase assembly protein PET191-domain-containing protein [Suillus placidus]
MSSSCDAILKALKECLLNSDCVQKQGHLPSECLKQHSNELPEQCQLLRKSTFECKRNMVSDCYTHENISDTQKLDMRTRFRGNTVGMDAEKLRQQKSPAPPAES